MSFTYTVATDTGKVRLLAFDTNPARYTFEDDEIATFLTLEGNSPKKAAALALETIASNEALVLKVITILDLQTDGAKTSDALLKRAAVLRDQAKREDATATAGFDIAEWAVSDFAARDLVLNAYRGV